MRKYIIEMGKLGSEPEQLGYEYFDVGGTDRVVHISP